MSEAFESAKLRCLLDTRRNKRDDCPQYEEHPEYAEPRYENKEASVSLKDQLIKLGASHEDLRPHLKSIIHALERTGSGMDARRIEGILKEVWTALDRIGFFVNRHEDHLLVHTISGSGPETFTVHLFLDRKGDLMAEYRDDRDRYMKDESWGDYYLDTHRDAHVVQGIVKTVKKLG